MSRYKEKPDSERTEVSLKEGGEPDPQLLNILVEQLKQELPTALPAGARFLRGKADQEWARAYQIKAQALREIGSLEVERQRLVLERDNADREAQLRSEESDRRHEERMYELRTQRLNALGGVVDAVGKLQAMGVTVDIRATMHRMLLTDSTDSEHDTSVS